MADDVHSIGRGTATKIRPCPHKSIGLTLAGVAGTEATTLLLPARGGFKVVLYHIGFSNSDSDYNNIALQWADDGVNAVDPAASMDTIFLRESLPSLGITLRNLLGMEVESETNQDLHGWLLDASDGFFVNLGYAYIPVPA